MDIQPSLRNEDLILRPFTPSDADRLQELAGDVRIADTTATIPHPYPDGLAEQWIADTGNKWNVGEMAAFAITLVPGGELHSTKRCHTLTKSLQT